MSSTRNTTPTPSTSNLPFDSALAEYYKHTGRALLDHPQVAAVDQCGSQLDSILDLFREQSQAFDKFTNGGDPKLIDWLKPIVIKLLAIGNSEALGADTTPAFHPDKYVLYGISALLFTDKHTRISYDILSEFFKYTESFVGQLEEYSKLKTRPTLEITKKLIKMLAELLIALAVTTKQINPTRLQRWLPVYGRAEPPIQRLDRLIRDECMMMALASMSALSLQQQASSPSVLQVSRTVLGLGSHGTVVYEGSFQGSAVAVKRLVREHVTLAEREFNLLDHANYHPNVIRYRYQEADENFQYIALALCPASLADIIQRPDEFPEITDSFNPKRALFEITSGLKHLHSLHIVHRDIKPPNILISSEPGGPMLVSDFGLCRKLEVGQTSFLPTDGGGIGGGTFGWKAPEILRGEVRVNEAITDDNVGTTIGTGTQAMRLTKSVDIFALGCLYYYCLTSGQHPFGDRFKREDNILHDQKSLQDLEGFDEDGPEAMDLIRLMLTPEAANRPDAEQCRKHPYFWEPSRRLEFLRLVSDRFEKLRDTNPSVLQKLESEANDIVGEDWSIELDDDFVKRAERKRGRPYQKNTVRDLLRFIRNQYSHIQTLPAESNSVVGNTPGECIKYFTKLYPKLFLYVYHFIGNPEFGLHQDPTFLPYF